MNPELFIPFFAIPFVFGIPIIAIWTSHQRKMKEMEIQAGQLRIGSGGSELSQLREEVRQLKDTALSYDLSFDTALQRMESRMDSMEGNFKQLASPTQIRQIED